MYDMDSLSFMQSLAECHTMPCHATPFPVNLPREPLLSTIPTFPQCTLCYHTVEVGRGRVDLFSIVLAQFHLILRISSPEEYNVVAIRLSTLLVTDFIRRVSADLFPGFEGWDLLVLSLQKR